MKWAIPFAIKRYATPLLSALLVAGVIGIWYHGHQTGKDRERAAMSAELDKAREAQAGLADELEAAQAGARIEYRDRIRTVYREPDPSGCAGVAVPAGVLDAIHDATR